MLRTWSSCALALALVVSAGAAWANAADTGAVKGVVTDADGNPLRGVMVSAFDENIDKSVTVLTDPDGSFSIEGLPAREHTVRARLLGKEDSFVNGVEVSAGAVVDDVKLALKPAEDLDEQRPGNNLFSLLKWDNEADQKNFKMMCMYCHQVGTIGFRTPEEPVDWETMVSRMQGFGGLYEHTQETLVSRLLSAYSVDAMDEWPAWTPPEPPSGKSLNAVVTEWDQGRKDATMIHDLELSKDFSKAYTVDMLNDAVYELDFASGESTIHPLPGGKDPAIDGNPIKGPHSIEMSPDGNMWLTLALSGEMAHFDVNTKEFTIVSSNVAPARRGFYPHTLRIDQNTGVVWYTDAAMNSVFSLDPSKDNLVKKYDMLKTDDQQAAGGRGESGGITPYGIDVAPDGMIWATKLNGNRVVRIDPNAEDGDVKEWEPPFVGPRRLHVAPDGIVWVPGFGDGVLGRFDPKTEEWEVYDLPDSTNEIPYALNIDPLTGDVWICGTGSDSLMRFIPETEEVVKYPMPSRVTYTREIEFDDKGNVFTCNSNYPSRHTERGRGSVIKVTLREDS